METIRAAIYARVSTDQQTTANQILELRRLAERRGFHVVQVYEETESGAKRRPVQEQVRRDAGSRFDVLLVWALDRLGRGGALEALGMLRELDLKRVALVSAQEPWLDTSDGNPFRDVLVSFSATVAKMERTRLIERTRAGLERARSDGKRLGRPPCSPVLLMAAADLVAAGRPIAEAARAKGINRNSLRRYLQAGGSADTQLAQNAPSPSAVDQSA